MSDDNPNEDQSIFDKEVEELGTLIDVHEIVEEKLNQPYTPNRAQRRAMAKRDRALLKRNPHNG